MTPSLLKSILRTAGTGPPAARENVGEELKSAVIGVPELLRLLCHTCSC
jgi:hypothetical protein